jgi:ribose transport system substrate-binding protein
MECDVRSLIKSLGVVALAVAALEAASAKADTVALVTINQQALFFNQINDGAKQAADKAGAKLVTFNANNVAAAQNSAIEDYTAQKVGGIVLVAIDVNGVKPAVTAAKSAGIPVVAIDARIPDGDNAAFIGVDNKGAGEQIGKYFALNRHERDASASRFFCSLQESVSQADVERRCADPSPDGGHRQVLRRHQVP